MYGSSAPEWAPLELTHISQKDEQLVHGLHSGLLHIHLYSLPKSSVVSAAQESSAHELTLPSRGSSPWPLGRLHDQGDTASQLQHPLPDESAMLDHASADRDAQGNVLLKDPASEQVRYFITLCLQAEHWLLLAASCCNREFHQ